jgi:holo-[acyl-carrier protein] synthase
VTRDPGAWRRLLPGDPDGAIEPAPAGAVPAEPDADPVGLHARFRGTSDDLVALAAELPGVTGIGVDLVAIDALSRRLDGTPRLAERLFTEVERATARSSRSLAARAAAKEAVGKALGTPGDLSWLDVQVRSLPSGRPVLEVRGTVAARCEALGVTGLHLSLTHDGDFAAAFVVAERRLPEQA